MLHDISGRRLGAHCKCLYSFSNKYLGAVKTTPRGYAGSSSLVGLLTGEQLLENYSSEVTE